MGKVDEGIDWDFFYNYLALAMPYSKIQFFTIQTPGFAEWVPDSELVITFSNNFVAKFEFRGGVDIGQIGRMISEYVME